MPKKSQDPKVAEKLVSIIEDLVKQQAVANNTRYAKRDFRQLFIDAGKIDENDDQAFEDLFSEFRKQVEQKNVVGSYKVSFSGSRKARVYEFTNLPEIEEAAVEKEDLKKEVKAEKKKYSHPEDTYHIRSHVALMFIRKCVCLSLEKTTGKKTGVFEHPDMIGVISNEVRRTEYAEKYPDWAKRAPEGQTDTQILGVEVKHRIESQNELLQAVIEARHNSRYFDEAWLVANINEKQVQEARRLGSEYNVGILNIDEDDITRSQIEWSASRSKSTMCPEDFLLRDGQGIKRKKRFELLEKCHTKASKIANMSVPDLYEQIIEDLLTNQKDESVVIRLPESVQLSLRRREESEDLSTFIGVVGDLIFSVYPQKIGDEGEGLLTYLTENNFDRYGEVNKDLLSKETYKRVKESIITRSDDVIKELRGVKGKRKWKNKK